MNKLRTWMDLVEDYLAMRRSNGYALSVDGKRLQSFAKFAEKKCKSNCLFTLDLAIMWAKQSKSTNPYTWKRRIEPLRGFAKFLQQFDPATEVPPLDLFGVKRQRRIPHIYTEEELVSLLEACSELPMNNGTGPATCRALIGLLSATGLRISEALNLVQSDVDFETRVITIRQPKFLKDRLVVIHPTVSEALKKYQIQREKIRSDSNYFFVNLNGKPLTKKSVRKSLLFLCRQLNLSPRGDYRNHRVLDLRHTFVVRSVLQAYKQEQDVDKITLALSTYVGHKNVADTYWYFTAIPELMAIASDRFQVYAQGGGK